MRAELQEARAEAVAAAAEHAKTAAALRLQLDEFASAANLMAATAGGRGADAVTGLQSNMRAAAAVAAVAAEGERARAELQRKLAAALALAEQRAAELRRTQATAAREAALVRHDGHAGAAAAAKTAATSGPDYLHAALAASEEALEEMAAEQVFAEPSDCPSVRLPPALLPPLLPPPARPTIYPPIHLNRLYWWRVLLRRRGRSRRWQMRRGPRLPGARRRCAHACLQQTSARLRQTSALWR